MEKVRGTGEKEKLVSASCQSCQKIACSTYVCALGEMSIAVMVGRTQPRVSWTDPPSPGLLVRVERTAEVGSIAPYE